MSEIVRFHCQFIIFNNFNSCGSSVVTIRMILVSSSYSSVSYWVTASSVILQYFCSFNSYADNCTIVFSLVNFPTFSRKFSLLYRMKAIVVFSSCFFASIPQPLWPSAIFLSSQISYPPLFDFLFSNWYQLVCCHLIIYPFKSFMCLLVILVQSFPCFSTQSTVFWLHSLSKFDCSLSSLWSLSQCRKHTPF